LPFLAFPAQWIGSENYQSSPDRPRTAHLLPNGMGGEQTFLQKSTRYVKKCCFYYDLSIFCKKALKKAGKKEGKSKKCLVLLIKIIGEHHLLPTRCGSRVLKLESVKVQFLFGETNLN
jgi:hypothetical protein